MSPRAVHRTRTLGVPFALALLRAALAAGTLATAWPSQALQPLQAFLEGAGSASTDNRRAALVTTQRQAEADAKLGAVLPSVSATGSWSTHSYANPYYPRNTLGAELGVSVPLVDLGGWARTSAARATARAAQASEAATRTAVEDQVVSAYYGLVGAEALRGAGLRSLAAAEENLALTRAKRSEGVATQLDVERASADVENVKQSLADAELTGLLERRSLLTVTGVAPEGEAAEPADDLREEAPLEQWEGRAGAGVPTVTLAQEDRAAAEATARAAWLALAPTLSAAVTLDATNAPDAYGGASRYATANATLTWTFDLTTLSSVRGQHAAAGAARVSEEAALASARDRIHEAWQRVRTGISKARAARAAAQAAHLAADLAGERYSAGMGTQLEVSQAQRDLLSAEATRIQADAGLAYARAGLRLAAGLPATGGAPVTQPAAAEGSQP